MNPQSLDALLDLLATGDAHRGETLAQALGISRAAVWKKIEALRELGMDIEGRAGSGYALARPVERLDAARLRDALSATTRAALRELRIVPVLDSTNAALRAEAAHLASGSLLLAEAQTAGRGRRGRAWASPFAAGFLGSLFWRFERGLADLGGLSLAVGIALAEAWRAHGLDVRVKWPNDLWVDGRKLAGLLIEAGGEFHGPSHVVVGLGLNIALPASLRDTLDQPVTDLTAHIAAPMSRNSAVAVCIDALFAALAEFERSGFGGFVARWEDVDALAGAAVTVHEAQGAWSGIARGIDDRGRLQVEVDGRLRCVDAGEVSIRLA
ncbi:MAG TPA: bifunctional biotin--[acetyl-CoA-carboxylase] ligase/biotin operon repressor BirA [Pseudomonadota bacterium]|nr:bifunctional biotin--[acetyl-CoA-carboxylase] ligase/biotin operon repressor BirA [Pseudomonadota bacterium]